MLLSQIIFLLLGLDSLLEKSDALGESGRKDPGRVESGSVPDHDHNLALTESDIDGGGGGVLGGVLRANDFQQLHLVHRGEVVHADDLDLRTRNQLKEGSCSFYVIC